HQKKQYKNIEISQINWVTKGDENLI
ncbi:MAG: hypothetical protein RIQ33_2490, partial [Bacteroidota bacterium]